MINLNELQIETPLSSYFNTPEWDNSPLGKLAEETSGAVYVREIDYNYRAAPFGWRVVYAFWSPEDTTMTRFRAYGPDGEHLPFTSFGVHYDDMPSDRHHVQGRFRYPLPFGSKYIWLTDNQFHTVQVGGYMAQVLDQNYPSEGIAFGFGKDGQQHKALLVGFRLCPLGPEYPNV